MQRDSASFIHLREMPIHSAIALFFFSFMQVVYDYLKKKVIARGNSDMTRDELHSEPSALRIDDRNQTSRHSSSQYVNNVIALRGAKTIKDVGIHLSYKGMEKSIELLQEARLWVFNVHPLTTRNGVNVSRAARRVHPCLSGFSCLRLQTIDYKQSPYGRFLHLNGHTQNFLSFSKILFQEVEIAGGVVTLCFVVMETNTTKEESIYSKLCDKIIFLLLSKYR